MVELYLTKEYRDAQFNKLNNILCGILEKETDEETISSCKYFLTKLSEEKMLSDDNRYFCLNDIFMKIPKGKTFGFFKENLAKFHLSLEADYRSVLEEFLIEDEKKFNGNYVLLKIRQFIIDLNNHIDLKEEFINYVINGENVVDELIKVNGVDFLTLVNGYSFSIMMAYRDMMDKRGKKKYA